MSKRFSVKKNQNLIRDERLKQKHNSKRFYRFMICIFNKSL